MPPQAPVIDDEYGLEPAKPAQGVTDDQYGLEPASQTRGPKIGEGRQAPTRKPGEARPLSEEEVNKFLPPTNFEAEGRSSFAAEHPVATGILRGITTLGGMLPESTHAADYSVIPGAWQAIKHPIESAKLIGEPMIEAQKERLEKAGQVGNEAQRLGFTPKGASAALSAATYAGEGIIPVLGPWVGGMADTLEQGIKERDPEGIARGVTQPLAAGAIMNLGGRPNQTAERVGEFVSPDRLLANRRMNNFDAVVRDLAGKTPADLDFTQTLNKARPDVAEIARKTDFELKGNARVGEFERMLGDREREIWSNEHKPQIEAQGHLKFDAEQPAQAARASLSTQMRGDNPAAARAVDRWVESALNPKTIGTVEGADNLMRSLNAANPDVPEPFKNLMRIAKSAAGDAIRGQLETILKDAGEAGVSNPNGRWGALREIRSAVQDRINNAANKPLSFWDTIRSARTPMVEGAIAGGGIGSLAGGQEGAAIGGGIGAVTGAAGSIAHDILQQPGGRIARAMKGLAKTGLQPDVVQPGIPRLPFRAGPDVSGPTGVPPGEAVWSDTAPLPTQPNEPVGTLPTLGGPVTSSLWGRPIIQPKPGFEVPGQELMGPWGGGTPPTEPPQTVAPMKPPLNFPPKGAQQEPLNFKPPEKAVENVPRETSEVPKQEKPTEKVTEKPKNVASIKMMITKADEANLRDLGYSQKEIDRMKPEDAGEILEKGQKKATPTTERRTSIRDVSGPDFYRTARMNDLRKTIADETVPQEDRDLAQRQLDDMKANPFERHEGKDINQVKAMNKPTMTREAAEAASEERKAGRNARFGEQEGILPGMGEHVAKQAEGAARVKGEELTAEMNRPRDVEEAAGRMETLSPLFRGTAASPQNEMFRPGGEAVKPMEKPRGVINVPAKEVSPTTKVLHTFPGEEGTQAEVAKIDKGFSVGLRDTDANEMVGLTKIYPTEEAAVAAAKDLVKPPEEVQVKGVTAKEPKPAKAPKAPKPKPIDQRFTQEEILEGEGRLNTEAGMMAAGEKPGVYYDEYSQEESPLKQNQRFREGERAGGKWRGVKSGRDMQPFFRDNPDLNPSQWLKAVRNKDSAAYTKFMERYFEWQAKQNVNPEEAAAAAEKKFANFAAPSKFVNLKKPGE